MVTRVDIGWVDPGYVNDRFAHSIASQAVDMQYFGMLGGIHFSPGTSIIAAGRNSLVEAFLKTDSDYLWIVDSDMVFDKGHPIKLVEMAEDTGADMVTGLAFIYDPVGKMLQPSLFAEGEPPDYRVGDLYPIEIPDNGAEIAACGMASVLIHRRVFEAMEAPRHYTYRWFDQVVLENGMMAGEDIQFFVRARKLGFTLRVCTEAETLHIKEIGFGRADYDRAMEQWDAQQSNDNRGV